MSTRTGQRGPWSLGRRLWIWPILAAIVLLGVGLYLRSMLEENLQSSVRTSLETILNADVAALRTWLESQEAQAEVAASDAQVRASIIDLTRIATGANGSVEKLRQAPAQSALRRELEPFAKHGFPGYLVVDREMRVIAADRDELVGQQLTGYERTLFERVFSRGNPTVSHPFVSRALPRADTISPTGTPTMLAVAPVYGSGAENSMAAALCLRLRPEGEFTFILNIGRAGESGETYAFDRAGVLLSRSRFDDDLRRAGLLVDVPGVESPLNIQLRDPQANLKAGERPKLARADQPLTKMVVWATSGEAGCDVEGYRDYRGVPVVGAWQWLHDYDFGVATEIDVDEAYDSMAIVRRVFWGLFALLGLGAIVLFVFTWLLDRAEIQARRASLEARRLGQYTLEEKIGEGGMGAVYRGHHGMLRRPTAVKLLDPERANDATIARFEREVRLTSQLNHPNTIAIFDFGRTPEGIFYYAMEYLDGVDLEHLVLKHGPQCEGRTVHILRQLCGSLREAHAVGLIHRDIKPANIMLNERGRLYDVVKVLDFGLVKAAGARHDSGITLAGAILGTPLYVSPESITDSDRVDARSDLYAVGAVAYFLLTGTPVFRGENTMEICVAHVNKTPEPPSQRLGRPISPDLERIVLSCLEKNPLKRPQSASALLDELADCTVDTEWTTEDAATWWKEHPRRGGGSSTLPRTDEIHVAETIIEMKPKLP